MVKARLLALLTCVLALCAGARPARAQSAAPGRPFAPRGYVAYRAPEAPRVDGVLDEAAWQEAPWTEAFVDMEHGARGEAPRLQTRAKMLWDDTAFYVAAQLEEPEVWATFTKRDTTIYRDNAFEVFIDPDGDTHNYYEFEINALGTVWDLMLLKPYRDGGPALSAWDIRGLEAAVHVDGTLNEPGDTDAGWTVELAFPWAVLAEATPESYPPAGGTRWRVNLTRAQWPLDVVEGEYRRAADPETGAGAEPGWHAWSPQGARNIHLPEHWGYVQFADRQPADQQPEAEHTLPGTGPNERVAWALRRLYYRQRDYHATHGRYAEDLSELGAHEIAVEGLDFAPELRATQSTYEITAPGEGAATIHIRSDGKAWTSDDG